MSYKRRCIPQEMLFAEFAMPFGGKLKANHPLVQMADKIPWAEIEDACVSIFPRGGRPAMPIRQQVGALILAAERNLSDNNLVQFIEECPYAQYFIGLHEFTVDAPFTPEMMVSFRKRFASVMEKINELIQRAIRADMEKIARAEDDKNRKTQPTDHSDEGDKKEPPTNKGKLLVDATVAPADIAYPTDSALLFKGFEKLDAIAAVFWRHGFEMPNGRKACMRNRYLQIAKAKKMKRSKRRNIMGGMLQVVGEYLDAILKGRNAFSLRKMLTRQQMKDLITTRKVYRQQKEMYDSNTNRTDNRIVSISQPWVRPIVRGKARAKTEFGAKISASMVEGLISFETISFNPFNESNRLIPQIEAFKKNYGFYPESVHVDKAYICAENRKFCKEHNIRISGHRKGRPLCDALDEMVNDAIYAQDLRDRIPIEGKFGEAKRVFSLDRIVAHLKKTTVTCVQSIAIAMNIRKWRRILRFFYRFLRHAVSRLEALLIQHCSGYGLREDGCDPDRAEACRQSRCTCFVTSRSIVYFVF